MPVQQKKLWFVLTTLLLSSFKAFPQQTQTQQFRLETKPVWEAGLGAGFFNGQDYPGSNDPNTAEFALPFFIYRSKIFRVGDDGAGAVAIEEPRFKVDVSFGGSLNAESESDSVRVGLPDLDLLFEFGPRVQYKLFKRDWASGSSTEITVDGKVRAVIATDFEHVRAQGFVYGIGLDLRQSNVIGNSVDIILSTDVSFADKRYNDNFYSVPDEFITAERPGFDARPGYVETISFLGLAIKPHPDWRLFTGIALSSFAGAANRNSPLFETDSSFQYAVGLVWTALRSKRTIDVYTSE